MDNFVQKAIKITNNLKNGPLTHVPYPSNEFKAELNYIAIGSFSYYSNETVDLVCTISCNFVKAKQLNSKSQIDTYEQPLQTFTVNVKEKSQTQRFGLVWFKINSVSDYLRFSFKDIDGNSISKDIKVQLVVYLR